MLRSHSKFTLFVVQGKVRLNLHRFLPDLPTALRVAHDLAAIRPTKLDGLFISQPATGSSWSVSELVEGSGRVEAAPGAAAEGG
jgi:hypothetical protein